MLEIKQKTGDYCFVAYIASALLDEGYDKLQELIVERFPTELQSKKRGVTDGFKEMEKKYR
jgi:hypothetical protein